jgi:carboxypeptidase C (cathepsin A)
MRYSMAHMALEEAYRKNVAFAEFDAGHMMYINRPDLQKMQRELENFLKP